MKAMFLKVNRDIDYAYHCIEFWVNACEILNYMCIFICDNDILKSKILDSVQLPENTVFIKSDVIKAQRYSKEIATDRWQKAAYAHLTTFLYAQENGISEFWNIDADDTSFEKDVYMVCQSLLKVEEYAKERGIGLFSLDMWWSMYGGDDWSFGVTFTNLNAVNILDLIEKHLFDEEYKHKKRHFNLDCFLNYLRSDFTSLIKTFYITNVNYVHWGGVLGPILYKYYDGYIVFPRYPLYLLTTQEVKFGKCLVQSDVVKIDSGFKRSFIRRRKLKAISNEYVSPLIFRIRQVGIKKMINIIYKRIVK